MTNKVPLADIGVYGPVDGMGERNDAGSYFVLSVDTKNGESFRFMASRLYLESFKAEIEGLLEKIGGCGA